MALRKQTDRRPSGRKRKIAREAVKNLAPDHREAIEATGYGPGDAYIALWDEVVGLKHDQQTVRKKLTSVALKPAMSQSLRKHGDYLRNKLIDTFIAILPYERPKLAMIKFQPDDGAGQIIDLKRLPDARLQQLKEITLLLTGAGAGGVAGQADDDPPGGAATPGGPRAPKGGKGLRRAKGGAGGPG